MSTVCVVKKNGQIVMASDTCTTFGNINMRSELKSGPNKIITMSNCLIGLAGSPAHFFVLAEIISGAKKSDFDSLSNVFKLFSDCHKVMRDDFFLNTTEDEDDPYESSQFTLLLATKKSIYSIHSCREVFEHTRYWAIGSGADFALGSMHTTYDGSDAERIAKTAVEASCQFDSASELPVEVQIVE